MLLTVDIRHAGKASQDIRRLRLANGDMNRTMGQPVVWRHRFTIVDLDKPYTLALPNRKEMVIATKRCPACYDDVYAQPRSDCRVCYGSTIVSTETDPTRWISTNGRLVESETEVPAPLWRGFGPPVLTWIMEPNAPEDVFKISEHGVLTRSEQNRGFAPWYPRMGDGDIVINVDVNKSTGYSVVETRERFLLATVTQETVRGFGKMTTDRSYVVSQSFEMTRLPPNHILQLLEAE